MLNSFMNNSTRNIFFLILLTSSVSILQTKKAKTQMENVAKRSFLFKEREYLHNKPLSNDMKSFIRRLKRAAENSKKREVDKDHMYVVQNGDIIPLKDMAITISDEQTGDFTVIPLIIPVTVRTFANSTGISSAGAAGGEEGSGAIDKSDVDETGAEGDGSGEGIGELTQELFGGDSTTTDNKKEYLNKVIEDFQDLITHEKEGKHSNEGTPCSVFGDWDSDAAGMQIRIEPSEDSHKLGVTLVQREPPTDGGLLCSGQWDIYGQEPFNHSSLIVLTAVSRTNKRVASFIGECRMCEEAETIVGNWMEGRGSKNCKDRLGSHTFYSDVFRKNNVRKLQQAHLQEISPLTTAAVTLVNTTGSSNTTTAL